MTILQFKLGGEFEYNVSFETTIDKQKLQTNDKPTESLGLAVTNVVSAATKFYRIDGISAAFKQITYSYPLNDCEHFVLELIIKSKENIDVEHILKTLKLPLVSVEGYEGDSPLLIEERNNLVEKIITLRGQIESYALGDRAQQTLSFDDSEEVEEDLF